METRVIAGFAAGGHRINRTLLAEAIFSAWRHNIVSRPIIEEEFQYMVRPAENEYLLVEFRKAAGGEITYPAIEEFVSFISTRKFIPPKQGNPPTGVQ